MITNGKDILLTQNPGTLPNVRDVLTNWFQIVTFTVVTKTVVEFNLVETESSVSFLGVVEPLTAQQLAMKPEGQRSWLYQTVWATPDLILTIDDVVVYNSVRYRVTGKSDWSKYGYVSYDLTQDFTVSA